jgi:charged multivesicular body protein 4
MLIKMIAAKAALRRKKTHEHSLDQTVSQIGTLEQQINAIESANINKETLAAMSDANAAMKHIHKGLTADKVDAIMYVLALRLDTTFWRLCILLISRYRDELREQNAMSDEIVNAITQTPMGEAIDDDELENELEELQQEELDEQMLKTGTVPVSDAVHKLPTPASAERMYPGYIVFLRETNTLQLYPARSRPLRRTTRKPSFGNCRPRWPCKATIRGT